MRWDNVTLNSIKSTTVYGSSIWFVLPSLYVFLASLKGMLTYSMPKDILKRLDILSKYFHHVSPLTIRITANVASEHAMQAGL